jgi:hypothetical protein
MKLRFAQLKHPQTKKLVWVQVSRRGRFNPRDRGIFKKDGVEKWHEVEASSWKEGIAALKAGETTVMTPADVPEIPVRGGGPGAFLINDEDVPVITNTKYADGWGSTTLTIHGQVADVFIAPEGERYVEARGNERADLIVNHEDGKFPELGRTRLRRLETSSKGRKKKKEERLVTEGKKQAERRNGNAKHEKCEHHVVPDFDMKEQRDYWECLDCGRRFKTIPKGARVSKHLKAARGGRKAAPRKKAVRKKKATPRKKKR